MFDCDVMLLFVMFGILVLLKLLLFCLLKIMSFSVANINFCRRIGSENANTKPEGIPGCRRTSKHHTFNSVWRNLQSSFVLN